MEFIKAAVIFLLAMVPNHPALNLVRLVPFTALAPEFAKALAFLATDFVRRHTFITLGMLATGAGHTAYALWGLSGEASLTLGILVLVGYVLSLVGLVRAFIQEQAGVHQHP